MTAMVWVLLSAVGLLFVGLGLALLRIAEMEREFRATEKADHAKCIAHVASVASNRFLAMYLRNLAEKWDTVDNEVELIRIRNTKYKAGGPTPLSLWLTEQADALPVEVHDASS